MQNHSLESQSAERKWPVQRIKYFPWIPNVEDLSTDPWINEIAQRNYISTIAQHSNDEDLILYSDVDEIPRPETVTATRLDVFTECFGFEMSVHYLKFNYTLSHTNEIANSVCTVGISKKLLERHTANTFRIGIRDGSIPAKIYKSAGWHFSYMMNEQQIIRKIKSFSHQELNRPEFISNISISRILKNKEDLFKRQGFTWEVTSMQALPKVVRDIPRKFSQFLVLTKFKKIQCGICNLIERYQKMLSDKIS